MANEERAKGRARESLTFYKRAAELDPNFAMAYARIGVYYGNQEQIETAKEYTHKAYDLRDRVSERERLYITEKYYSFVTGEIDKTIETLQTWARLYPDDFIPHNNLSLNYKLLGRHEEALKEALEAVRLSPNNINARENLVTSFMALGRLDEAEQAAQEYQNINPDALSARLAQYFFAFLRHDQAAMERQVQWASGRAEEAEFTSKLTSVALYQGKAKQAEELQQRALEIFKRQNRAENASGGLMNLASELAVAGKCDQAKANAKAAINLLRGQTNLAKGAGVYAACDDLDQAQSLLDEAREAYPKNTIIASVVSPIIAAAAERERGNFRQAVQLLEVVRPYELGTIVGASTKYMRGNLYLQQRMGKEAAAEFKAIIDRPAVDFVSPVYVLAHLGFARAAALNGDTAAARKSYQDFFALWKDADPDLPMLVQAKKEYEQLK